jgi:hypothetical protein
VICVKPVPSVFMAKSWLVLVAVGLANTSCSPLGDQVGVRPPRWSTASGWSRPSSSRRSRSGAVSRKGPGHLTPSQPFFGLFTAPDYAHLA